MYRLIETCILLTFSCINLFTILHASSLMQRQAPHHAMFLQTRVEVQKDRTGTSSAEGDHVRGPCHFHIYSQGYTFKAIKNVDNLNAYELAYSLL